MGDPSRELRFVLEDRLECLECHHVRYKTYDASEVTVPIPVPSDRRVFNALPTLLVTSLIIRWD